MQSTLKNSDVIIITGATGVIGSALVTELEAHSGAQIVAASSESADLTNFDAAIALFERHKPKVIYHLAARVSGIMGNLRGQGQAYLDNVRINTNTIEAARLAGVQKIIAMGTAAIYSDKVALPMHEEEIWIGAPHGSEAGYAHAKRGMLAQLQAYKHQYGLDYAYCVSTNLFGPHDRFDEENGHVIPSLISKFHRAVRDEGPVTVWGTGSPERDFLYAADAARAMRLIGENFSGPINLASGIHISIKDTVELLRKVAGGDVEVQWDRTKPDGQKLRAYDVSKLRALNFEPQFTLEQGLEKTYRWYTENAATARR